MNQVLKAKLAELPKGPGVYFHKDSAGQIIYIGKGAVLKNRVRQYFQSSRVRDPKTDSLVADIADIDYMQVDSEMEALFLEAELIRRYRPKYNILARDDKSLIYIRIDYSSDYPTVTTTRRPLDDKARYFGPYFSAYAVRQALRLLRKIFPYATSRSQQKRSSLYYHLGLDPGLEEGRTSLKDYRANLRRLIKVIEGRQTTLIKETERDMKRAARERRFEEAAKLRNQVNSLKNLSRQVIFSDKEFLDISKDHALSELVKLLSLSKYPRRIEGFDISHISGSDVVASLVVFANGVSHKSDYRKFKTRLNRNDDFANMAEIISRRFSAKNVAAWGLPSLVLIDGGKGQLQAAIEARDRAGHGKVPFIGLAKREEQLVIHKRSGVMLNQDYLRKLGGFASTSEQFELVDLPSSLNLVKLLQRIRDESHRFAVSYHQTLRSKRQSVSWLDSVPGVGPATRRKLLRSFGSVKDLGRVSDSDLVAVVGPARAATLRQYLTKAP